MYLQLTLYEHSAHKLIICLFELVCMLSLINVCSARLFGVNTYFESNVASFRKSETEQWQYSISNARCLLVKETKIQNLSCVVHFEYLEPNALESFD